MTDFARSLVSNPLAMLPFVLFISILALLLVSKMGGWSDLSRRFRATQAFQGRIWQWKSARMRAGMGYNNCLTIGSSSEGLYLAVRLIPRFGHLPLFIPWQEVSVLGERTVFFIPMVEMRLGREEQVPFLIRQGLGDEIKAAAGAAWPIGTIG